VVVHEGNDLFLLTAQEAVNACEAGPRAVIAEADFNITELDRKGERSD